MYYVECIECMWDYLAKKLTCWEFPKSEIVAGQVVLLPANCHTGQLFYIALTTRKESNILYNRRDTRDNSSVLSGRLPEEEVPLTVTQTDTISKMFHRRRDSEWDGEYVFMCCYREKVWWLSTTVLLWQSVFHVLFTSGERIYVMIIIYLWYDII